MNALGAPRNSSSRNVEEDAVRGSLGLPSLRVEVEGLLVSWREGGVEGVLLPGLLDSAIVAG